MERSIPTFDSFKGVLRLPGDKSLAHRAVILAAIAGGVSVIGNLPQSDDVNSTIRCMEILGAKFVRISNHTVRVFGVRGELKTPEAPLDCGNSGTTMRLLAGLLAGADVSATLVGDASLSKRPMRRIAEPLRRMGADISTTDGHAPLVIRKRRHKLTALHHVNPIPSAQLKSALMLAALFTEGLTAVTEPSKSRDHSERLFAFTGLPVSAMGVKITLAGPARPRPFTLNLCGDPSSAAYFAAAALINAKGRIQCENVMHNQRRLGFYRAVKNMGADIRFDSTRQWGCEESCRITAKSSRLRGIEVKGRQALDSLDELPLLASLALFADGMTEIRGGKELRKKESDRIRATTLMIKTLGGEISELDDGWKIKGPQTLRGALIDPCGDHRIAMTASVIGTRVAGIRVKYSDVVKISYPQFFHQLDKLAKGIHL